MARVLMLCVSAVLPCVSCLSLVWTGTRVATSWADSTDLQVARTGPSNHRALGTCTFSKWCSTFCKESSGNYILLSLISAAWNVEANQTSLMDCYTRRPRQNILTAQSGITVLRATKPGQNYQHKIPELITDGLYDVQDKSCYASTHGGYPYVVLDLGRNISLSGFSIRAQETGSAPITRYFKDLEVRLGTYPTYPNFNSYTFIAQQVEAAPYLGYEFIADVSPPVTGRYFSIQRMDPGTVIMQFCHLEIYEEN